jgi:hypothetical protein
MVVFARATAEQSFRRVSLFRDGCSADLLHALDVREVGDTWDEGGKRFSSATPSLSGTFADLGKRLRN